MSRRVPADRHGDLLDWLYERGKQRAERVPEFDVERTISRAYAARDAGAVNFWSVLSPAERNAFESAARKQVFEPGTTLVREGEQADAVMVILDGRAKVCLDEDGRERIIAERGPGDLIGESGTMPGNVRSATMTALDTVQALVIRTEDYTALIADFPGVPDLVKEQTYDRRTGRS